MNADELNDRETNRLLECAMLRGFSSGAISRLYVDRMETLPRGEVLSLPAFLRLVDRGEYDHLLKDTAGNSYS